MMGSLVDDGKRLLGDDGRPCRGIMGSVSLKRFLRGRREFLPFFPVKKLPSGDVLPLLPLMAMKKRRRMS